MAQNLIKEEVESPKEVLVDPQSLLQQQEESQNESTIKSRSVPEADMSESVESPSKDLKDNTEERNLLISEE